MSPGERDLGDWAFIPPPGAEPHREADDDERAPASTLHVAAGAFAILWGLAMAGVSVGALLLAVWGHAMGDGTSAEQLAWEVVYNTASVPASALAIGGGVGLLLRRAWARPALFAYAGVTVVLTLVDVPFKCMFDVPFMLDDVASEEERALAWGLITLGFAAMLAFAAVPVGLAVYARSRHAAKHLEIADARAQRD